jgi:hypothetical protein
MSREVPQSLVAVHTYSGNANEKEVCCVPARVHVCTMKRSLASVGVHETSVDLARRRTCSSLCLAFSISAVSLDAFVCVPLLAPTPYPHPLQRDGTRLLCARLRAVWAVVGGCGLRWGGVGSGGGVRAEVGG